MPGVTVFQKGFTLVELMIASVISLTALSAIVTVYAATARHSTGELSRADLQQQTYTAMELITSDIRRSGYWAFDPLVVSAAKNPFTLPENRLRNGALDNEAPASCLLFGYDLDRDGRVGKGQCRPAGCTPESDDDNMELFGYRLNRGRLQVRYGGAVASCNSGSWQAVTTPAIVVGDLRFLLHANCLNLNDSKAPCTPGDPALVRQAVEFHIEASLAKNPEITLQLTRWIDLRNAQLREAEE